MDTNQKWYLAVDFAADLVAADSAVREHTSRTPIPSWFAPGSCTFPPLIKHLCLGTTSRRTER